MVQSKKRIQEMKVKKKAQETMVKLFETGKKRRQEALQTTWESVAKRLQKQASQCFELAKDISDLAMKIELAEIERTGSDESPF